MAGSYPPTCSRKGGSFCPLPRRCPVRPQNMLENNEKGVRARHGQLASCQRVGIAFDAGRGTREGLSWACFSYTPRWLKNQGVSPFFDNFPIIYKKSFSRIFEISIFWAISSASRWTQYSSIICIVMYDVRRACGVGVGHASYHSNHINEHTQDRRVVYS